MTEKQLERILEAILANRLRTLPWREFLAFVRRLGARPIQGEAGHIRVVFPNGARESFHRPHPRNELRRKDILKLKRLLENAEIWCPA